MWNDALRVAKFHGGQSAHKRVAYAWALALGGDAGAKLLTKQVHWQIVPLFTTGGFVWSVILERAPNSRVVGCGRCAAALGGQAFRWGCAFVHDARRLRH